MATKKQVQDLRHLAGKQAKRINLLECLSEAELGKLKQHGFKPEHYLGLKRSVVITRNAEDMKDVDEIADKLGRHAAEKGFHEYKIIHLAKACKQQ